MFTAVISKLSNNNLFETFLNASNNIIRKYKPINKEQAYELFESEYNVTLRVVITPKHSDIYYVINFSSEQDYQLFLYQWTGTNNRLDYSSVLNT